MAKSKSSSVLASPDDEWRAREDLRTLTAAHGITSDRARLGAARRQGLKQMRSLGAVTTKLSGFSGRR